MLTQARHRLRTLQPSAAAVTRVLYSGFRFSHHNAGSGYDACVPEPRDYVCGNRLPWGHAPEASLARHVNFLLVDLVTLLRARDYDTVHYLFPENTAYLSPWILRQLGKRIVYTVHLSEREWLGPVPSPFMRLKQRMLRSAHVIVTLSRAQQAIYAQRFRDKTVLFIPHGLEFGPPQPPPLALFAERLLKPRLVVVGHNYRDFDALEQIIASRGARDVMFHLVGMNAATRERFSGHDHVICHERLDAPAYEALLRSALALVLPLTFATANNAILEAYRTYLPVLASRIPGVTDYALDAGGLFGSPQEFWTCYDELKRLDASALRRQALRLEQQAREHFSWPVVQRALAALYG